MFQKYRYSDLTIKLHKTYKKDFLFLHLIELVREKMPFPCSYLLGLKNLDKKLWNLLFFSGRKISIMCKNEILERWKDGKMERTRQENIKTDSMKFWQGKFIEKSDSNEVFLYGANTVLLIYRNKVFVFWFQSNSNRKTLKM